MTAPPTRCPICHRGADSQAALTEHLTDLHKPDRIAAELAECFTIIIRAAPHIRPRRPCNKVGYPNREQADMALRQTFRDRSPRRREVRIRECEACAYWHLTSEPNQTSPAQTAALQAYRLKANS